MHTAVKNYILNEIDRATGYVAQYLPVDMPIDDVYEALVGEPHVIAAFHAASIYMKEADGLNHVMVKYGDIDVRAFLRLTPTKKWRCFTMPNYEMRIDPESKLGQATATAVQVAQEWHHLRHVTTRMANTYEDHVMLSFFMPWIRTLDFTGVGSDEKRGKAELKLIEREIRTIKARPIPSKFPSLTQGINEICKSGNKLFGQYRMLQSTMTSEQRRINEGSPISIYRASELPKGHWIDAELEEIRSEWQWRA